MKTCIKCNTPKQLSEFHNKKTTKDGKYAYCKICKKERDRISYLKHKGTRLKKQKEYHQENKEVRNLKNRESGKRRLKNYTDEERKEYLLRRHNQYLKGKENAAIWQKEYRSTEKGKTVQLNNFHKRRAVKIETRDGTLRTLDVKSPLTTELQQLLQSQDHKCTSCNCDISEGANPRHLDHIQPLSKGGTHSLDNVQWLCASCNLSKGANVA